MMESSSAARFPLYSADLLRPSDVCDLLASCADGVPASLAARCCLEGVPREFAPGRGLYLVDRGGAQTSSNGDSVLCKDIRVDAYGGAASRFVYERRYYSYDRERVPTRCDDKADGNGRTTATPEHYDVCVHSCRFVKTFTDDDGSDDRLHKDTFHMVDADGEELGPCAIMFEWRGALEGLESTSQQHDDCYADVEPQVTHEEYDEIVYSDEDDHYSAAGSTSLASETADDAAILHVNASRFLPGALTMRHGYDWCMLNRDMQMLDERINQLEQRWAKKRTRGAGTASTRGRRKKARVDPPPPEHGYAPTCTFTALPAAELSAHDVAYGNTKRRRIVMKRAKVAPDEDQE